MHVIGTAGHVDHGKSALVHRLTGIDPDRFAEEKRRGLTIDLGFAWLRLPSGREVGLVDVPGHERFIKNMLAGAGGISVCLFVVAANEGWMPQSAEHLAIIDVLGIPSAVVALTKIDTVDAETVALAAAEVEDCLGATALRGSPIVPCSALTGAGLDELREAIDEAVGGTPAPPDLGRPRLWIDRVFTIAGAGTVVTGTLAGGSLSVDDEVEISPERRRARVRTIQSHKKDLGAIGPGNRVALNLAGLDRHGAARGDAVVRPGQWQATTRIDTVLRVVEPSATGGSQGWGTSRRGRTGPDQRGPGLTEKGAHLLYAGSAETPVRIKLLGTDEIQPGRSGFAQLYLRDPLPLARGDRFVLRDAGRVVTLGGGEVLDPLPAVAQRGDARHQRLIERLINATPERALQALVEYEGEMDASQVWLRAGTQDTGTEGVERLGPLVLSRARLSALQKTVREALTAHHRDKPLERGMPREALRAAARLGPGVFDELIGSMTGIEDEGKTVRLAAHAVELTPEQKRARDALVAHIEQDGFNPPPIKDLDADPALLRALEEEGQLVRIESFFLTRGQADEVRRRVRRRIEEHGPLTVAEIRDLLETSRKYAVPLSEWLDRTGATRRQGDVRRLGPRA